MKKYIYILVLSVSLLCVSCMPVISSKKKMQIAVRYNVEVEVGKDSKGNPIYIINKEDLKKLLEETK